MATVKQCTQDLYPFTLLPFKVFAIVWEIAENNSHARLLYSKAAITLALCLSNIGYQYNKLQNGFAK